LLTFENYKMNNLIFTIFIEEYLIFISKKKTRKNNSNFGYLSFIKELEEYQIRQYIRES